VTAARTAWKAVVAFLAPGLLLLLEPVVRGDTLTGDTLTRALIVAGATSLAVWLKRNGASADPATSTPGPSLPPQAGLTTVEVVLLVLVVVVILAILGLL
jgi:hypothetical protein